MNEKLAHKTVKTLLEAGVEELCFCSGKRNAPLIFALRGASQIKLYGWTEERSAAFFALGRARVTGRPVAVVVTSGTAAGELLPAVMEAYYTSVPLIVVTADRPRSFRGTGAPQSAEQVGLYGVYAPTAYDIEGEEEIDIRSWAGHSPLHLNICLEEPAGWDAPYTEKIERLFFPHPLPIGERSIYSSFLKEARHPLVIVSGCNGGEELINFLLHLQAPVYAEGISQLREEARLQSLLIPSLDQAWSRAEAAGYPIDAVLRIGGVPTVRLWRDLEEGKKAAVLSISEHPFSGSTQGTLIHTSIADFCRYALSISPPRYSFRYAFQKWKEEEEARAQEVKALCERYPLAEPSLMHTLSSLIPLDAHVYLGNSLPIREWDQAACRKRNGRTITANRGVNGIDGQVATFLGLTSPHRSNWGIFGDLTLLYDLISPWIIPQLEVTDLQIVVINNGGGMFFNRFFKDEVFLHAHALSFEPVARLWGLLYERWERKEQFTSASQHRLIEIIPDPIQTKEFTHAYSTLSSTRLSRASL